MPSIVATDYSEASRIALSCSAMMTRAEAAC